VLTDDWKKIQQQFKDKENKVLWDFKNTDLIQSITLLSTYYKRLELMKQDKRPDELPAISCKRKEMLNLTLDEYLKHRDKIVDGYRKAAKILLGRHIYSSRDLPYATQLIPMAAILVLLGNQIENMGNVNKLMQWFWCGVFGELYGGGNETRYALDLPQVVDYITNNGPTPKTIYDANFSPSRLHTLRTRNSAAYKGIYALLLEEGTKDWLSATTIDNMNYFSESIDIHHIFPVAWCLSHGKNKNDFDCIVNKTPLSGRTNRFIRGDAPSEYLPRVLREAGVTEDEFNRVLSTHDLDINLLRADDFSNFIIDRKNRILDRIEKAMGKKINREVVEEDAEMEYVEEVGYEE